MSEEIKFKPCSPICPAVTGKPSGSVRFCPMKEHDRHRSWSPEGGDPKNYTDCCANFQCCGDLWEKAGLSHVAASLVEASKSGGAVIAVGDPPALPGTEGDVH